MNRKEALEILREKINPVHAFGGSVEEIRKAIDVAGQCLENVPDQPSVCVVYKDGVCCYPIEACSECPRHRCEKEDEINALREEILEKIKRVAGGRYYDSMIDLNVQKARIVRDLVGAYVMLGKERE